MIEGTLSRRYAKAFFELAREQRNEDVTGSEIGLFLSAYTNSPLQTVLNNPAFDLGSRKTILVETSKSLGLSPLSAHFLSMLLERDRLVYLSAIVSYYRRLLNAAHGRIEAKVVAATAPDSALLDRLRETLRGMSGKDVILHHQTDPAVLGGLLIEIEGTVYDGTLRTQLENMKQRIARDY